MINIYDLYGSAQSSKLFLHICEKGRAEKAESAFHFIKPVQGTLITQPGKNMEKHLWSLSITASGHLWLTLTVFAWSGQKTQPKLKLPLCLANFCNLDPLLFQCIIPTNHLCVYLHFSDIDSATNLHLFFTVLIGHLPTTYDTSDWLSYFSNEGRPVRNIENKMQILCWAQHHYLISSQTTYSSRYN